MARKLAIDSKAVAYAVLEDLLNEDVTGPMWESQDSNGIAHHLLEAGDVEYLPRARRLTLSFDLSGDADEPGPGDRRFVGADDEPVPYVPADDLAAAADAVAAEHL